MRILPITGQIERFWVQNGTNIILPHALTYDSGAKSILAAWEALRADPQRAEKIAAAGHELVRRALRPETVRR